MQRHKTPTNRVQSTLVVPSWRKQWVKQVECQSLQDSYHANKGTTDLGADHFSHGHWVLKVNTKTDWQSMKRTQKNINRLEDTRPRRHCTDNHTDKHNYTTVHCYELLPYIFYIGPLAQHLYQTARGKNFIQQFVQSHHFLHCNTINHLNFPIQSMPWSLRVQQWWKERGRDRYGTAVITLWQIPQNFEREVPEKHVRAHLVQIYVRHCCNTYVSFILK
jgi:hypothetical protein